ncbi:MAG: magnesium chelatase ATPase subunit I, partial [Myxococcaceae bacterium]|nr:magnesium chelatase ATPase subunit I [Myxococcaceae bacterium]
IGSGNPEEGELRPQLLDRFGLSLEVKTPTELPTRVEVVKRRAAFERDPGAFLAHYQPQEQRLTGQLDDARRRLRELVVSDSVVERASALCLSLGTDGLRGELTLVKAARAAAALDGTAEVTDRHLRLVAPLALRHRLRRSVLDEVGSAVRVEKALDEVFPA